MTRKILFDAYGTLFDLSAAAMPVLAEQGSKGAGLFERWRDLQLRNAWLSALQHSYAAFDVISREAFDDVRTDLELPPSLTSKFMNAIGQAPLFSGCADHLRRLRDEGCSLAILSNGTAQQVNKLIENSDLQNVFDHLVSVESAKTYKPSPDAYRVAEHATGWARGQTLFVSSNDWDVRGALSYGFDAVWLDRGTARWPASWPAPPKRIASIEAIGGGSWLA